MSLNTGNFHVFFPDGCYRDKPTPRRNVIFLAIDNLIQKENFDLDKFDTTKKAYLQAIDTKREKEAFAKLNNLIKPLFSLMLKEGFSKKELQNYEGII